MGATQWNPSEELRQLRWKEDMLITNDFGERVWLKPCIVDGKRVGITDCCPEDNPCEHHIQKLHGHD